MLKNLMESLGRLRAKAVFKHSRYRAALNDVPGTLFGYWRDTEKREFPCISCNAVFLPARRWS